MKHYVEGWSRPKVFMARVKSIQHSDLHSMEKVIEVNNWCAEVCVGRYWKGSSLNPMWAFEDDEDYTAFILRWVE